jgi:hypothetical protein
MADAPAASGATRPMGGKITTPYRSDKEHLRDLLQLIELRQRLYTLKTRAFEWVGDGIQPPGPDAGEGAATRDAEIEKVRAGIATTDRRIAIKTALARSQGRKFSTERVAEKHDLSPLEVDILLVLLLEDITVSGGRTYARGKDILGLLLDDRMSVLDARRHLYSVSPLMRHGLMTLSSPEETSVLDAYFKISERAAHELTGGDRDLGHSTDGLGFAVDEACGIGPANLRQPTHSLDDVILPAGCRQEVEHFISLTRHAEMILGKWGFGETYRREGMTTALFCGPPGTGKTMTADAVSDALGQQMLVVSYPEMVSKWVGETEKNIARAFAQASANDAVLLFDEADAMFHTRVAVSSATDQSFNREVNVLLQEVERFSGVLILTTNRDDDLDPAFERRIGVRISFPVPDATSRQAIWRMHVPETAPVATDVDYAALARTFPFAGGHIRNAVLRAAAGAASRKKRGKRKITMHDLRAAAEREMATSKTAVSGRRIGLGATWGDASPAPPTP